MLSLDVVPVARVPLATYRQQFHSGFTFRAGATVSNAQQTPKLPDWALIDVTKPSSERAAGEILAAGFFDEFWRPSEK